MSNIFEQINSLPILEVLDSFNIGYTNNGLGKCLLKPDGTKDTSFSIDIKNNIITDFGKTGIKGGPFDFIGQYYLGFSNDDMRGNIARANTVKVFIDKGLVQPGENKQFEKSYNNNYLLENYNDFKLNGYKDEISQFLINRGVDYGFIKSNSLKIGEIFKNIGYYNNYFCTEFESYKDENGEWNNQEGDNPKQVGVFMFPCYNEKKELIGFKLRRKDGKTIRGKKSLAVGKTGLIYENIDKQEMIIVEGETDYIILKILGFDNVIGNLGGVMSGVKMIKDLLFDVKDIICLYDNDSAGERGIDNLEKALNRKIKRLEFPIRENVNGERISDVNDLYKAGYDKKKKWDDLLLKAEIKGESNFKYDFIFLREDIEYFDIKYKKIQQAEKIAKFMGLTGKELFALVNDKKIPTYEGLCYYDGGKPGMYNLLDKSTISTPGEAKPRLHPDIKLLIQNVCNNKKINYEWLHRAILYKYTHLNDVNVPAVILYGKGGSGKGSFINLLTQIFGEENTLKNLKQRDLESSFDSYQGNKLIVEFQEIISGNTMNDKKTLDRIKSMVGEKQITVNAKFQNARTVDNIAWFHFSSNHPIPIQLDSKDSGNRRFTIIKTGPALNRDFAHRVNEITIKNKQVIKEYLARLFETYPEVTGMKVFPALDNSEKQSLELNCESSTNLFFNWVERKFPYITKISNPQKNILLDIYCKEEGEDKYANQYKQKNFDNGLSHKYEKKLITTDKPCRGYLIHKTDEQQKMINEAKERGEKYVEFFKKGELEAIEGITF